MAAAVGPKLGDLTVQLPPGITIPEFHTKYAGFTFLKDRVTIHLDLLSREALKICFIPINAFVNGSFQSYRFDFSKEYANFASEKLLEESLKSRNLTKEISKILSEKYAEIFRNYSLAHQAAKIRADKPDLNKCGPELLVQSEQLDKALADAADTELVKVYNGAVDQIQQFTADYLNNIG